MKYSQTYSLTNLGLFLNLLMFGADLVVNKSVFHAGAILLLKLNFLTFSFTVFNRTIVFCVSHYVSVTRRLVTLTVFAPVFAFVFSWHWSKLPFRLATSVTSCYFNPLTETVFFSACCGSTHWVVCTSCIVVGNTRQCLLYVLLFYCMFYLLCATK